MKKRFLTITASILAGFIGLVPVASATVFQEYYTADDDGELKAEVVIYDLHPPTAPELLTPANGSETCLGTTPFSWREATDNKAVTAYKFSLTGTLTSGEGYNWEKSFGGAIETEEFQVWKENGVFYLRLKNKLGFGSYRWQVTASDSSNNSTESGWQNFEYTLKKCRQECIGSSETGKISLVSPKNSIDSRSPAINFVYTGSTLPVSFDVEVDGTAVFSEIPAVSSNTARYTVSHTLSSKNVIFQPLFAYLPEKSGTQSYAITVTVYLDDGCVASAQVTAELTGGSAQALVPQLISPSDDTVDSVPITTFVWDIADPSGILTGQIFTLNGVNLFNLGTQATETDDYTLSVQEITGGDLGKTSRCNLTLKKTSYTVGGQKVGILTNNGNDSNDWNRWQVTAQARQTGSEAPALASPVWRFRYIA
ncbi:hypothetical protein IJJ12_01860, partial [bacterium]|nr:hypothetical protein [bacterium]